MTTTRNIRSDVHTGCQADELRWAPWNRPNVRADFVRARAHNTALRQWETGDNLTSRDSERAILDLIAGVASWVDGNPTDPDNYDGPADGRVDPFAAEYIVGPMLEAIHNALNYDMGRLMGGPLSSFVSTLEQRAGVAS